MYLPRDLSTLWRSLRDSRVIEDRTTGRDELPVSKQIILRLSAQVIDPLSASKVIIFITHDGGEEDFCAPLVVFCCLEFRSMMVPQVQLSCYLCSILLCCRSNPTSIQYPIRREARVERQECSWSSWLKTKRVTKEVSSLAFYVVIFFPRDKPCRMCHCLWEQHQILKGGVGWGANTAQVVGWLTTNNFGSVVKELRNQPG